LVGGLIGVHWSLALAGLAVLVVATTLLAWPRRRA